MCLVVCSGKMRFIVRKCRRHEFISRRQHESRYESNFAAIKSTGLVKVITLKGIERCGYSGVQREDAFRCSEMRVCGNARIEKRIHYKGREIIRLKKTNSLSKKRHHKSRHESNFGAICGICSWGIESTDLVKKLTFKGIERCGCSCHQYQSSTWSGPWRRTAKGSRSEWARAAWRQQALHGEPSPHPQR